MSRLVPVSALVLFLALGTGCAAVVAGAAGYGVSKYAGNGSQRSFAADGETTWLATLEAMREAGYPVASDATFASSNGRLSVSNAKVRVQTARTGVTHVLVRIGTFDNTGNRQKSRQILDAIEARLAPAAASVTPVEEQPVEAAPVEAAPAG